MSNNICLKYGKPLYIEGSFTSLPELCNCKLVEKEQVETFNDINIAMKLDIIIALLEQIKSNGDRTR